MVDTPLISACPASITAKPGSAVYYSGTVAAAREAAMCYIPAMAVSIMRVRRRHAEKPADIAVRLADISSISSCPALPSST
jgi:broad specificity polyphosphatase/5'/3'-nucleotidase SurE